MNWTIKTRLVLMGTVQETTITLGEAARRLDTTVAALLAFVYEGQLPAVADPSTGRLLVKASALQNLPGR